MAEGEMPMLPMLAPPGDGWRAAPSPGCR